MHAHNAALFLGQIQNPKTGEGEVNLELAKMFIDQLSMISDFFFSSRRRHTRSLCDWSSDVCSSDLLTVSRGFVRKQRGMNAAEDDPGAALAHLASDLVTAERVAGMNADADDVARANRVEIDRIQRFVDDDRIAPAAAGRRREDVEPARRNHGDAERFHTRIDKMNARQVWTSSRGKGFVRAWSGVAERSEKQERSVYAGSTRTRDAYARRAWA